MWFEVLKGGKFEDKEKHEGEEGTLKKVSQETEVDRRRMFIGIEI